MASAPRPVRSLQHGMLSRSLASGVALSVAVAPWTAVSASPWVPPVSATLVQDSEIERLYVEGEDKYAEGDYNGAADAWTQLLDRMPEAQANRATRENVMINVLQAHLDGYARSGREDIEHLRSGKAVVDGYFDAFKSTYGDDAAVSAAVQEKADELTRALEEAEASVVAPPPPDPGGNSGNSGNEGSNNNGNNGDSGRPDIVYLESQNDGGGLIAGGAITAGLSLVGFGLMTYGVIAAARATEDYDAAQAAGDDAALEDANQQGRIGNALTVTGVIVGPVLLITGGVLIGLGIKRRKDAKEAREQQLKSISVTPTGGRGFGGLAVHGRF